ncbi:hypothetical protein PUN28_016986 [Cardiocondyla obscurior]|uniref:DUF4371 domain-containing protein n=1 Tax=Cardiocondyla obscurior TaxID=286306 RepID=A0AAW2EQ72_9HYME
MLRLMWILKICVHRCTNPSDIILLDFLYKVVKEVLAKREVEKIISNLKISKFSVLIDKSTDITRNKLMCVLVKYVSPNNGQVLTQLLESVSLDAKDCSASKLFESFKNLLIEKEIPITNISEVPLLITLNCICHSSALVASKACKQLPSTCENLIRNIHSYISGSSKRCAILREFEEFFNVESNKLLKLCNTRWLILQKCVARILENWEILKNYFIVAVVEDKLQTAEIILDNLNNNKIKAYFLFLKYVLNFFNNFV